MHDWLDVFKTLDGKNKDTEWHVDAHPHVVERADSRNFQPKNPTTLKPQTEYALVAIRKVKQEVTPGSTRKRFIVPLVRNWDEYSEYFPNQPRTNLFRNYHPPRKMHRLRDENGKPILTCAAKSVELNEAYVRLYTKPDGLVLDQDLWLLRV